MRKILTMLKNLFGLTPKEPVKQDPEMSAAAKELLAKLNAAIEKGGTNYLQYTQKLASIIMPEVLKEQSDPMSRPVDRKAAKLWAGACAQMIALLSGIAVKNGQTDFAVNEIMETVKGMASSISNELSAREIALGIQTPLSGNPTTPKVDTDKIKKEATLKERRKAIQTLKDEASGTADEGAKQALLKLAEMMERELELESKAA